MPDAPPLLASPSTPLPTSRALAAALLLAFAAGILVTGAMAGLVGSTETRYAEIAREMVASGDGLIPRLNGAPHLEKPPLTYWMIALAFHAFGVNDVAARVPGLVAAAITLLVVGRAARRLAAPDADATSVGRGALVVLATMPAFLLLARTVSTEVWLTLFSTAAGAAVLASRAADGKPGLRWVLVLHGALALGMLTKGPAVFLTPLAGAIAVAVAARSVRTLRPWVHPLGLLLFAAVGVSWYLLANQRLPGLVDLYLTRRLAGGVFSGEHHNQPLWRLWGPVLLGGMPWAATLVGAVPALRRRGELAPLLAMALATPIFFSFSSSRGLTYGLPSLPWIAVMVAAGAPAAAAVVGPTGIASTGITPAGVAWHRHLRRAAIVVGILIPLGAAAFWSARVPHFLALPTAVAVAALAAAAVAAVVLLGRVRREPERLGSHIVPLLCAALALAMGAAHAIAPAAVKANRGLVDIAKRAGAASEGEIGVAVHTDGDWALFPFYAQRTGVFFGYSSGRVAPEPPEQVAPERFRPLDGPNGLAAWFRAPERRWLLLRTTTKNQDRDPWRRLGDGPVVVVARDLLYSVVTNR